MDSFDKNYLRIQFRLKVHEKSATEFQGFFEDVMQAAFQGYRKVLPYGNKGDGGNDGYRPDQGIYYQVYAPNKPDEKQAEAAVKLKNDFEKLKRNWDQISIIREFNFVFNDQGKGVSIVIESALAELRTANKEIEFKPFYAKHLEDVFFTLTKDSMKSLGFDIDSRNALRVCREILASLEVYLDRGNASFVFESLQNLKDIIDRRDDESLHLEWEILECRALQQLERIGEAKEKYETLCKRYPRDPRPLLYLAEIYLNGEDYARNDELLTAAAEADKTHWLLPLEQTLRDQRQGKKIDPASIDERTFPTDPKIRSNYYRFYAGVLQAEGDIDRAESFIERAIKFNPDRIGNHITKLGLMEVRTRSESTDYDKARRTSEKLVSEIDAILSNFNQWGQLTPRNQAILKVKRLRAFQFKENYSKSEGMAKETIDFIMQCYFDAIIDLFLAELLMLIQVPPDALDKLLTYLRAAEKGISDYLSKALVFQFNLQDTLYSVGKTFFLLKRKDNILNFIANLEDKNLDEVWNFMKDDSLFAVAIAHSARQFPDLRRKIVENLPDDGTIQKDKLLLLLNYDESKISEAFDILKGLDLSKSSYFELRIILEIAQKRKAWDFASVVLEKLLDYEKHMPVALQLKLGLFDANLNLKRLPTAIEIGEKILANREELALLNDNNKEILLAQTVIARLTRGDYREAEKLIEMHLDIPKTIEFKIGVEAEVYLKNGDAYKAIAAIVDGIRIVKTPTPEQYAKLFIFLNEIDNMIPFPLSSLQSFEAGSFVKLKAEDRWYFVGDGDELDAVKIPSTDQRYAKFLDKKVGDKVVFDFKYRAHTEHLIESILPIEKYIFSQTVRFFNQLAAGGNLEAVEVIEVPKKGDTIDTTNIIARLKDERRERGESFDLYCRESIPLAFLAITEGGLTSAIALIQNEQRGFVRFSSGEKAEIDGQKTVAKRTILGEQFYIDGTSALILAETGLLEELHLHLPNLKVPQSVIAMLLKCRKKFEYVPGQAGHLGYAQGKLRYSPVSADRGEALQRKFEGSVKLLESKPENIGVISAPSEFDCWSEQRVPAELCDACVLAQRTGIPVLTEDFRYL